MKYQYMPMFWGDFFANTLHLSTHEIGAYVLLIAHAWEHEGRVPYDGAQRIARVDNFHWVQVRKKLEPFFEWEKDPVMGTPSWGTHHRVLSELTKSAELSNKRKAAAQQKHSKSSANGNANGGHLSSYLPIESLNLGKGSGETPVPPQAVAEANDYRSPPKTKSDHVLAPLPDKQPPRPPAQTQATDKKPTETSRQDLDAIYAARSQPFKRPNDPTT